MPEQDSLLALEALPFRWGSLHELEGLGRNEPYTEFLLSLTWRSRRGWTSEMHVLGIVADDDVEVIDE